MKAKGVKFLKPADVLIEELVLANRILANERVVDGFGHVSVRHDKDPTKFLMSCSCAPRLVTAKDILVFDLNSDPIVRTNRSLYSERFIHSEMYRARPDVQSVVHCHSPLLIPFGVTKAPLRALANTAPFFGKGVPVFESREIPGMISTLVQTPAQGKALADKLADRLIVLMRGHGATVVGASIRAVVETSIYAAVNAEIQMNAMRLGEPVYFEDEEITLSLGAGQPRPVRLWEHWVEGLKMAGGC